MRPSQRCFTTFLALGIAVGCSVHVWAVPYASGVRNTSGSTWEFVLNEAADDVTVTRDGGNALNLGALAVGRHTFDMTGFSTFEIGVSKSAAASWAEISSTANLFTSFVRPEGMTVNTDPSTPYFGTVYVNNARNDIPAGSGRVLADGLYALTADLIGTDLRNNFAVVADPDDTSVAYNSGWTVDQSTNSAWRMTLDDDGNVIVADWSDASGGIKYARRDFSGGGPLLIHEDGITPLLGNSVDGSSGPEVHGSIVSKPYATGSIGNNLVVYAMDEDQDSDGETLNSANTGNHVWRWNIGNVTNDSPMTDSSTGKSEYTGGYDQPPQLAINVSNIPDVSDGQPNFLDLNVGVLADAHYEPQFDKWYLTQRRSNGTESGLIVVTADGVDGNSPTLDWSSKQFSIDNNLDGFTDDPTPGQEVSIGLQDIFREIGSVAISPDGKTMAVSRPTITGANPYMGAASPLAGNLLIIPLDVDGLPDIQIDDNGTPGDITDDFLSNVQAITIGSDDALHFGLQVAFDTAGNLYSINNASELLQVFSPGGSWNAVTKSDGTFALTSVAGGITGDYNENGSVDAADYVMWRKNEGQNVTLPNESPDATTPGVVDTEDYEFWAANFGNTSGSGSSASPSAVPEPSSALVMLFGLAAFALGGSGRRP